MIELSNDAYGVEKMIILRDGLNSKLFDFRNNTFFAEASDFRHENFQRQIYDDACDVGFGIESAKTHTVVRFYLSLVKTDCEGDIEQWEFKPIAEDVRKFKLPTNLKAVIFND